MANEEYRIGSGWRPSGQWGRCTHSHPQSHHGTPVQEYSGFDVSTPRSSMASDAFNTNINQQTLRPQLPLIMPRRPSILNTNPRDISMHYSQQPAQSMHSMAMADLVTPGFGLKKMPPHGLTDLYREQICLYKLNNPDTTGKDMGGTWKIFRSSSSCSDNQKKYLVSIQVLRQRFYSRRRGGYEQTMNNLTEQM